MRVLFICNQNKHRSKMAEELFSKKFETKSAGLYSSRPVNEKQMQWAELIVVMENGQRTELAKRFPKLYLNKRIVSLDIPDVYNYGQAELIEALQTKMSAFV